MFAFRNVLSKTNFAFVQRTCLSISSQTVPQINLKFTSEEESKVLGVLNKCTAEELETYSISKGRIKNIVTRRDKKGPYTSLEQVLEVDGLGEKVLSRICSNIINNSTKVNRSDSAATKRIIKNILVPASLPEHINNELDSVVAVHLEPTGTSWAKLSKSGNTLVDWKCENFSSLPIKMSSIETFNQALGILNTIPSGDVYVFEQNKTASPQAPKQMAMISSFNQQSELVSMLMALLNTSPNHNVSLKNQSLPLKSAENRVFFLRPNVPARLFRTLIGNERVSALNVIKEFIENDGSKECSVPCKPINIDNQFKSYFYTNSAVNKELLGKALMLVVTFMELCVHKSNQSLGFLSNQRNNK